MSLARSEHGAWRPVPTASSHSVAPMSLLAQQFCGALDFDQDLSGWDWNPVVYSRSFLGNAVLSPYHHDALLLSLAQDSLPNFGLVSSSKYSDIPEVVAARSAVVDKLYQVADQGVSEDAATLNGSITSDGGDAVTATGYRWGAMADLSDAQDLAGSGTSGAFTGSLTGLTAGTT